MNEARARLTMKEPVNAYQTWRFDRNLPPGGQAAFEASAKEAGLQTQWLSNERFGSTYVLLCSVDGDSFSELAARYPAAEKNEAAVIALGIEPEAADALPALVLALGGPGAPAGVTRAEVRTGALIVEVLPSVTPWSTIKTLIDVELRRFGNTARSTVLLAPLPVEVQAQVAADGLRCEELHAGRVLESLIQNVDR